MKYSIQQYMRLRTQLLCASTCVFACTLAPIQVQSAEEAAPSVVPSLAPLLATESDVDSDFMIYVNRQSLLSILRTSAPGTMYEDKRMVQQRVRIEQELEKMHPEKLSMQTMNGPLSMMQILLHNKGAELAFLANSPAQLEEQTMNSLSPDMALLIDGAGQAEEVLGFIAEQSDGQATAETFAGMTGIGMGDYFIAVSKQRLFLGSKDILERAIEYIQKPQDQKIQTSAVSMRYNSRNLLAALKQLATVDDEIAMLMQGLNVVLGADAPTLTLEIDAQDTQKAQPIQQAQRSQQLQTWSSRIALTSSVARLLRPIDQNILQQHQTGAHITLACAVDPAALLETVQKLTATFDKHLADIGLGNGRRTSRELKFISQILSAVKQHANIFAGDFLLQSRWQVGPVPGSRLTASIQDVQGLRALIEKYAPLLGISAVAGKTDTWQAFVPVAGSVTVTVQEGGAAGAQLVVTVGMYNDQPVSAVPQLEANTVALCDIDTQSIARMFLPMAYGLAQSIPDTPLRSHPLDSLRHASWAVKERLTGGSSSSITVSSETVVEIDSTAEDVVKVESKTTVESQATPDATIAVTDTQDRKTSTLLLDLNNEHDWTARQLQSSFAVSRDELTAFVDTHISIYQVETEKGIPQGMEEIWEHLDDATKKQMRESSNSKLSFLLRSADGYHIVGDAGKGYAAISAEALTRKLRNMKKVSGVDPAELALLTIPSIPTFRKNWLPDIQTAIDHTPAYSMRIRTEKKTIHITESGLPLAGAAAVAAGASLWGSNMALGWKYQQALREQEKKVLKKRHADLFASMEKVGAALQAIRGDNKEIPKLASQLVDQNLLKLEDCEGLCAGIVPVDATVLDRIGRWTPEGSGWQNIIWAIRLDKRWVITVSEWGSVQFIDGEQFAGGQLGEGEIPGIPEDLMGEGDEDSLF